MAEYTLVESILLGALYLWAWMEFIIWPIPRLTNEVGYVAVILGLAYGEMETALVMGGTIGLMYISNFSYGATPPSDTSIAGIIAIPMAIKFGLTAGEAVAIAVPFGLLGALINNMRRAFNGIWWRLGSKAVSERKYNKLIRYQLLGPFAVNIVCRFLPLTLMLYFCGTAAGNAVASMPDWLSNAFSMMGKMLPGVGLVLCISIMGNRSMLPYAVIGFFLLGRFGFVMVEVAIFGIVLGMLHTLFTADPDMELDDDDDEEVEYQGMFSTKDMVIFAWYWTCFYRVSQCMEYFYGLGNGSMMYYNMRKIYKDDEDGLQKAMERALEPWISHPMWGAWMLGAQFAMEEDIAKNGDPTEEKGQAISAMKTGFMGPFAGIGDTIYGSILNPICRSFAYTAFLKGDVLGVIPIFVLYTANNIVGLISCAIGYKAGVGKILKIVNTPLFKRILTIAIVTGMMARAPSRPTMLASKHQLNSWMKKRALNLIYRINSTRLCQICSRSFSWLRLYSCR